MKTLNGQENIWSQSSGCRKGLRCKGFAEEPSLKVTTKDWTSERKWKWW